MQLPACQGIGRILLFLWIRTTSLCMVVCACQAVGKGKLCDLFSRSPKRHIADWFNACAITKLFSFSSPFVERFSGLTRDCHYFPNSMSLCVCLYMYSTDWGGCGGGEWGYVARILRNWYSASLQDSGTGRLGSETEGRNHIFFNILCLATELSTYFVFQKDA